MTKTCEINAGNWTNYTQQDYAAQKGEGVDLLTWEYAPGITINPDGENRPFGDGCDNCENSSMRGDIAYEAKYSCGNGTDAVRGYADVSAYEVGQDPDAVRIKHDRKAMFSCEDADQICKSGVLTVDDTGLVSYKTSKSPAVTWSFEPGEENPHGPYASNADNQSSYLGKGVNGKLTPDSGSLVVGDYIGSPNGALYLRLEENLDDGAIELVAYHQKSACGDPGAVKTSRARDVVAPYAMAYGAVVPKLSGGDVAYVTADNEVKKYPNETLSLTKSYKKVGDDWGMSAEKLDTIATYSGGDREGCEDKCTIDHDPDCFGYVYQGGQAPKCLLYGEGMYPATLDRVPLADAAMYVRLKQVDKDFVKSETCNSKEVKSVFSSQLSGNRPVGAMTEDTRCMIGQGTEQELTQVDENASLFDQAVGSMETKANELVDTYTTLGTQATEEIGKGKASSKQYRKLGSKQEDIMRKHGTVLGMDDNAALEMLSSNYQMIMWTTVGVGVALACLGLARR